MRRKAIQSRGELIILTVQNYLIGIQSQTKLKVDRIRVKNLVTSEAEIGYFVSNCHSPQIRQNGELLVRMCRGESHFSQKWRMSNVSECIESGENGWRMSSECIESGENGQRMSSECIESGENGWRMSGECIESDQNRLANVGASKIGRFMHK